MQTIKSVVKERNVLIFLAQIGIYFMLTATWCVVGIYHRTRPMGGNGFGAHQRCYVLSAPRGLYGKLLCACSVSLRR